MQFSPCRGGIHCTQDGTHCQGCGRSHGEIAATREIVEQMAQFALQMDYENLEEFTQFVADKAAKKTRMMKLQAS